MIEKAVKEEIARLFYRAMRTSPFLDSEVWENREKGAKESAQIYAEKVLFILGKGEG